RAVQKSAAQAHPWRHRWRCAGGRGMKAARPFALAALVGLAGCASDRGIEATQTPRPVEDLASASSLQAELGHWPDARWWEQYGSPTLNALIDEALANNPRIAEAAARLASANAALEGARSALGPRVDAHAQANWQRYSENGSVPEPLAGAFKASGSLDLTAN